MTNSIWISGKYAILQKLCCLEKNNTSLISPTSSGYNSQSTERNLQVLYTSGNAACWAGEDVGWAEAKCPVTTLLLSVLRAMDRTQ